ncbi:MAG: addiction module protein [Candidatus Azotimanducaceae bacterium WSBS_2022_MAG_OTU7]
MPTNTLETLRPKVLSLSESERAELANELIKSLDAPADEGVAEAWDKEITRRIAQIDSGEAELLSLDEFRRRMRAKIGSP